MRALVHGTVQGVGFRFFVLDRVRALGLTGYVRNLPGGRAVEVVASGPLDALDELTRLLHQGPPGAHVERVDVEPDHEPASGSRRFEIVRW